MLLALTHLFSNCRLPPAVAPGENTVAALLLVKKIFKITSRRRVISRSCAKLQNLFTQYMSDSVWFHSIHRRIAAPRLAEEARCSAGKCRGAKASTLLPSPFTDYVKLSDEWRRGLLGLSPPVANRDFDHFAVGNSESLRGEEKLFCFRRLRKRYSYIDKVGRRSARK